MVRKVLGSTVLLLSSAALGAECLACGEARVTEPAPRTSFQGFFRFRFPAYLGAYSEEDDTEREEFESSILNKRTDDSRVFEYAYTENNHSFGRILVVEDEEVGARCFR